MLLEVLADAERPAGAGEHHAARGRVLGHAADGLEQRHLGGDVEAVHRVGAVERDGGDAVGQVEEHGCVGHAPQSVRARQDARRGSGPRTGRRPGLSRVASLGEQLGRGPARPVARAAARRAGRGRRTGTCATRARGGSAPANAASSVVACSVEVRRRPGSSAVGQPAVVRRPQRVEVPGVDVGSRVERRAARAVRAVAPARSSTESSSPRGERADPHVVGQLGVPEERQVGAQPGAGAAVGGRVDERQVPGAVPRRVGPPVDPVARPRRAAGWRGSVAR